MTYWHILKKTWYKYVVFIVLILGTISIMLFSHTSSIHMFLFIIASFVFLFAMYISTLTFIFLKRKIIVMLHQLKKYLRNAKYRLHLLWDFNKVLTHQYSNHSVEIVFAMFVHFYEHHLAGDIDQWAFPEDVFPEGKFSLTKMYKYIKKTRVDNQAELMNIEYDEGRNQFSYWGEFYSNFHFKIRDDQLIIQSNEESGDSNGFYRKRMRIENELYELNNEKAKWIIDRRKYLMI